MRKKILFFILLFLFSITSVKAADVAEISGTTYSSLSSAISAVNSPNTTITLLMDRSENITIPSGKSIILDLNGYTLRNNGTGDKATVVTNNGTLEIKNGTITTDAASGMINNNDGAVLKITSGNYIATGTKSKQALYNNKGTATISGDAYFEASTSVRAVVHNLNGGKLYIIGGTIVGPNTYGVYNDKGTLEIGTKDEVYNQTSPVIQGKSYGVIANNSINVYDGVIKGGTYHIGTANSSNTPTTANDVGETKINDYEELSEKVLSTETIGTTEYKTFTYNLPVENIVKIIFDPAGGTVSPTSRKIFIGDSVGTLPEPVKQNNEFNGWFTESTGGTQITEDTKPTANVTYYAQWTYVDPNTVAYVEGLGFMSLEDAFAIGGNIRLERDVIVTSALTMSAPANFDLNGYTITLKNKSITIKDEVTIDDSSSAGTGKITSNSSFTVIVGSSTTSTNGHLIHKGGTIEGLGAYGAIRNYETVEIDGGTVTSTATTNGFTIYNQKELILTSGTVYSSNGRAIQVYTNSTFVMNGGLVKTDASNDQAVNLYGDCSATINDGTIEGLEEETAGIAMFKNTELIINGGTIKGSSMAIAGNGSAEAATANITMNGGNVIGVNGTGIYLPQRTSTTTINDGNITGATSGIELRASELTINGGTITSTSNTYEVGTDTNGTTVTGAAVAISQHTTKQPINVVINDGNFKAMIPVVQVNPLNNPPEATDLISILIKQGNFETTGDTIIIAENLDIIEPFVVGGIYSLDPTTYVKEGYGVVKLSDNKYEVTKVHNIIIDSNSKKDVSTDKDKYPYKSTVELNLTLPEGAILEVKDIDGKEITVTNNKFTMPDKDVNIKIIYKEDPVVPDPVEPVKPDPINPITGDNILSYILLLLLSIVGFLSIRVFKVKLKDIK